MDLDHVFKEGSLTDLQWLSEGLLNPGSPTHDPTGELGQQDIDTKPEIELQWGYGDIEPEFNEPNAGEVERNIPVEDLGDASPVIMFARDQMNAGVMGRDLVGLLKQRFDQSSLMAAREGLSEMFRLQGIVGCVAIDGRGYKSCREAMKMASRSPFKRFIRYVIGCECGDHEMLPDGRDMTANEVESTGNPLDDFLGDGAAHKEALRAHCRSTMLPVIAGEGDLDESEMDQTLVEVLNLTGLPGDMDDGGDRVSALKRVFRELGKLASRTEVESGPVGDPNEHRIEVADQEIDLTPVVDQSQIDVDLREAPIDAPVDDFTEQDVEMGVFLTPEFEGVGDVVEVDEPPELFGDLVVERGGEVDFGRE